MSSILFSREVLCLSVKTKSSATNARLLTLYSKIDHIYSWFLRRSMASKTSLTYGERAQSHRNPVAKRLLEIAEEKKTNVVVSADLTTNAELLDIADSM